MHKLGDTFYLIFPAHAATGELHDADSTPVVEVFEDASDTAMAYLPTVAKVGTNTGYYRATIVATAGNGFEAGKCYNIMAKVVMGGLDRSARIDLIPSLQAKDVDDTNTAIGALNNVSVADVEQACEDGLADYGASTATEVKAVEDKVDDVYTDTQRVDGLIEDDGTGNDRFTQKALEQAPTGGGTTPPTVEEIRQEIDANSTMLADIYTDTQRVDGLIENSSGDRFKAKALEEAPTGGGSAFLDEDTTTHTVLGSFGFALGSIFGTPVVVESKTSQYKLEITLDKRITELINDAPVTGDVYTFIYLDKDGYNHQGSINLDDIATGVVAVQGENRTKTPYTLIFTIHNAGNTDSWSRTIAQITIL